MSCIDIPLDPENIVSAAQPMVSSSFPPLWDDDVQEIPWPKAGDFDVDAAVPTSSRDEVPTMVQSSVTMPQCNGVMFKDEKGSHVFIAGGEKENGCDTDDDDDDDDEDDISSSDGSINSDGECKNERVRGNAVKLKGQE